MDDENDSKSQFKYGWLPDELLKHKTNDLDGLTGDWHLVNHKNHASEDIGSLTHLFGLDPKEREAWDFWHHINSPKMRLKFEDFGDQGKVLHVGCEQPFKGFLNREIYFNQNRHERMKLDEIIPNSPVKQMPLQSEFGFLTTANIDGCLHVKFQMDFGTFYMTRVLLMKDPTDMAIGPVTLAKYCMVRNNGEEKSVLRYHTRDESSSNILDIV